MTNHENQTVQSEEMTADTSAIWENHVSVEDTPDGFTLRTTYPTNPDIEYVSRLSFIFHHLFRLRHASQKRVHF